jgi:hypothetical protein
VSHKQEERKEGIVQTENLLLKGGKLFLKRRK